MTTLRTRRTASPYKKKITVALALYILYIFLCLIAALLAILYIPSENEVLDECIVLTATSALFFVLVGSAIMIFGVIPKLKKEQAKRDFSRHDFLPYVSVNERETFTHEALASRYTFTASPFDTEEGDGETVLQDEAAIKDYFESFASESLISEHTFEGEYPAFFISCYGGPEEIPARAVKNTDERRTTVDLYYVYTAEFTDDGLNVGGVAYPYDEIEANVIAFFGQPTAFFVRVRILLEFERGYLSFEFSSRIAAVIERFGIKVRNREVFDYVLSDPLRAFEQTARQLVLKKLK